MKAISFHVPEPTYQEIKSMAARQDRPVAEVLREAMTEYIQRNRRAAGSLLDIPAHDSGTLLEPWTRSDILDEIADR